MTGGSHKNARIIIAVFEFSNYGVGVCTEKGTKEAFQATPRAQCCGYFLVFFRKYYGSFRFTDPLG